ncbi:MAG: hypothetical protein ACKV2T_23130 [Kofleriaceae bacterium]
MQRALVVILVTVGSSIAVAQPSTVTPIAPALAPEPVAPAPRYPRTLVDRPLLMPEGTFDIGLPFAFRNDRSTFFTPYGYFGTSAFEFHAGVDLQIGDQPERDSTLAALVIGGLREVAPDRVPGLAVGAQLVGVRLGAELPRFSPKLLASYKRRLAPFFAIVPSASLGYTVGQAFDETDQVEGTVHQFDGTLMLRAQLQAGRILAFEALISMGYFQDLGDYGRYGVTSHGEQTLGITTYLSISPNTDIRFTYSRAHYSFSFTSDGIVLALNIRKG